MRGEREIEGDEWRERLESEQIGVGFSLVVVSIDARFLDSWG